MKSAEKHPSVFHPPYSENMDVYISNSTTVITPPFPNWEKSFVSGTNSPLFEVKHFIDNQHPYHLYTRAVVKDLAEGPPGHVHGGATAGLIDELMGIVIWHNQLLGVTQTLQLFYWKMVPLNTPMYAVSDILKAGPAKIEVRCTLFDNEKTPYVSALAVFHRLTPEHLEMFKRAKNIA